MSDIMVKIIKETALSGRPLRKVVEEKLEEVKQEIKRRESSETKTELKFEKSSILIPDIVK